VFFPTARSAVIAESGLDVAQRARMIGASASLREDTEDSAGGHGAMQIHCPGPHASGASVSRRGACFARHGKHFRAPGGCVLPERAACERDVRGVARNLGVEKSPAAVEAAMQDASAKPWHERPRASRHKDSGGSRRRCAEHMNAVVRRQLEMAKRCRGFLRDHPTDGAGAKAALDRLEELIRRAEELSAKQRNGVAVARSATTKRRALRETLLGGLVRYLVAVGVVAEMKDQFRLPKRLPHETFLTTVKGLLATAEAHQELLVSKGMQETLLEDLRKGVSEFEASLETSRQGRRDHVGASHDLETIGSAIVGVMRVLDGLVRYRFRGDAELMGAWQSARNVVGPFGSKGTPSKDESRPQGPGDIAPAA
jgi:hypothetical protein